MEEVGHYLKQGIHHSKEFIIKREELASFLKTGDMDFVATPSLIVFMEQVVCELVHERIPPEYTSISAEINIKHLIPVNIDSTITCSAHLKFVDQEKLFFDFAFFNNEKDIVAIGAHERFIVLKSKFPK
ncbi:thioesterase family protein [Plebeiibacterium sediminum]|uniref:Fluoroacetyl-CoA-specific thioesterase-like domain-containing protein n=1 Tax=Plebeiibacterium sediminum TaxID=2992112 RepID=A0AAE3M4C8_9BACT|nr:hypothetical protein [Plebeiobacterium sediminum]MCW3787031.1 hypothetical protein [Plebeiobacterium sediminum]